MNIKLLIRSASRPERGRYLSFRYCSRFFLLTSWLLSFVQKHEDICQYGDEQCQACGESVERRHLDQHRTKNCINRAEACTYCGGEVLHSNMEVRNTWASPLLPVADPDLQIRGEGGGSHPDPEIRGGRSPEKFFSHFGGKIRGSRAPREPPLVPPLTKPY